MRKPAALAALAVLTLAAPTRAENVLAKVELADLDGKPRAIPDAKARATVVFFVGAECPNVARYAGRMNALARDFAPREVAFVAVNPNARETADATRALAKRAEYGFPVIADAEQRLAPALGVDVVPTAVVIDGAGKVLYRGAIDDNKVEELARHRWLRDALEAIASGKAPAVAETKPQGCLVQKALREDAAATVTWSNGVAKIVYDRCAGCHRPGQVAPFSLTSYEQARRWSQDLKRVCEARVMPPWKPLERGVFRDERTLTDAELATLTKWVDAGAPAGDLARAPQPPVASEGWQLGEPDLVLEADEYEVPSSGPDEYRCFVIDPKLTETKWVSAVELRPGNRNVVHHILGYLDTTGEAKRLDAADPLPGYRNSGTSPGFPPVGEMGGWAPGTFVHPLPDGVGRLLPKTAQIVLQVHYHKNGKAQKDRSAVGLYFAKQPIERRLDWIVMVDENLKIPAGEERHRTQRRKTINRDIDVLACMPHMHLLGREALLEAQLPDGTKKTLIHIADWDFNWQDFYFLKEPLHLPKGTTITGTMWYDNSSANPNNPHDPPRDVEWGEQTTDEMFLFYVGFVKSKTVEAPAEPPRQPDAPVVPAKKKKFY